MKVLQLCFQMIKNPKITIVITTITVCKINLTISVGIDFELKPDY